MRENIAHWGEGYGIDIGAPSLAANALERHMYGTFERAAMSPGMAAALWDSVVQGDIRHVLPAVLVPTLIIHHSGSSIPVENARYAAEHVPNARYVELEGVDHLPITHDADAIADEIEEFLIGARGARRSNRRLATALFTDIVGSTELVAELGDRRWSELLDRHNRLTRAEFERHDGREVKHTGDGFLALFDGPARAIRCARDVRDRLSEIDLGVRIGIHSGECELASGDVGGMAIHLAARVMDAAGAREILVSGPVKDLVAGSEIQFEPRGVHALRGAPGEWALFAVGDETAGGASAAQLAPVHPGLNDRFTRKLVQRAPRLARAGVRASRR